MYGKNITRRSTNSGFRVIKKMNILLLATRLNLGGIGIYVTSLAKALKEKGHHVVVASSGGVLVERLDKAEITHIRLPIDTSADIGPHTFVGYVKLLRIIKEHNIELIHAHTRVTQVIANILFKRKKIHFVTTCHGFFKKRLSRRFFPCWGERVIAISDAVKQHLVSDMRVSKENVRLVYNGIDIRNFTNRYSEDDKKVIKKEYGLKDKRTIGIISRFSDVKGIEYLLGAFGDLLVRFPDLQLLLVGDGRARYVKSLKNLASSLGVDKNVVFHKAVNDTSIPLSIIDLFCLPSVQEGLGLSIIEAMSMGIPVVASDVGGIYTLIKDGKNGFLVPPKNEKALAEALEKVLSDSSLAKKMGDASKAIVSEKFTLDMMSDKIINVYKEVLQAR